MQPSCCCRRSRKSVDWRDGECISSRILDVDLTLWEQLQMWWWFNGAILAAAVIAMPPAIWVMRRQLRQYPGFICKKEEDEE